MRQMPNVAASKDAGSSKIGSTEYTLNVNTLAIKFCSAGVSTGGIGMLALPVQGWSKLAICPTFPKIKAHI